jgi:hypothetical protein
MPPTQRERIQQLLTADPSPERAELLRLGFDALASEPLAPLFADPALVPLIAHALTLENVQRDVDRLLLPAVARVQARLAQASERVRDGMPESAQERLIALLASGKGPRFAWLEGAIDPGELRQLFAPVVQQVLAQFTAKLPIPGVGGGAGAGAGLGGLVGMLGKQVSRGASQLADVGKSVLSGLGSELQSRLETLTRDFSQTAVAEFRSALTERLKSDEGREIVARIRDRVIKQILATKLTVIVDDFLRLPVDELAAIGSQVVAFQPAQPLFSSVLQGELAALVSTLGQRSLVDHLTEAGILDEARAFCMQAVEPGLKRLAASDAFGDFLDRLLAKTATP